ncbi:hypothetical protein AAEX37_00013 [Oligella sp. MSHR50489EDL]|uniref:NUDIX hydrolase n=1 Tax=Oligella sp. MSHR50489EDL TaxID=3139409 RepID=UPI003D81BBF7
MKSATEVSTLQSAEGVAEVVAVLVAVTDLSARVLTVNGGSTLPYGPLTPVHRSLQAGVREWVREQTQQPMGYVEQLYTFVDIMRTRSSGHAVIYISYLGLVREAAEEQLESQAKWLDWYLYFPWEDHRQGRPAYIDEIFLPHFKAWIAAAEDDHQRQHRQRRVDLCWAFNGKAWLDDYVLSRYELLYEVGLIPESPHFDERLSTEPVGTMMRHDHRRVLATAISRLRAKIKYRPVIFELMPREFTLLQLQESIESLAGMELHKQNFRRLIQHQDLLEATGKSVVAGRGRPAQRYRFKETVLLESILSGNKLPLSK